MPDTNHVDDLHGRLVALADRADDFEPPLDPYGAVRRRSQALRRRRLAGSLGAAAAAVAVAGALATGAVLPHGHTDPAASATPSPSLSYEKGELPDDAPLLPATGPVGTVQWPGESLTMKCADPRCPVLLSVDGKTRYYRLPDQPGALPLRSTSLSEDGRWLYYHVDGRAVLRNLVTGITDPLPAGTALTAWEQHTDVRGGPHDQPAGTPLRWALASAGDGTVYRIDLTDGTTTRYDPAGAHVLGVQADGDLLVAAGGTGTTGTTAAGVPLRRVDPTDGRVMHELTIPARWGWSGATGTPAPDGRHALLTGAAAVGSGDDSVLLVDLTTGTIVSYDLAELAAAKDPQFKGLNAGRWTPLGFLSGGERFSEHVLLGTGERLQPEFYLAAPGTDHATLTLGAVGINNDPALYLTLSAGQLVLPD